MARRPDLEVFAEKHDIKLGTIADLIEYRNNTETTIERVAQCHLPTEFATLSSWLTVTRRQLNYHAMQKGDLTGEAPLVQTTLHDTFYRSGILIVVLSAAGR